MPFGEGLRRDPYQGAQNKRAREIHAVVIPADPTEGRKDSRGPEKCIYGMTRTVMPTHAIPSSVCASQLASRKQPCDSVIPTLDGSGVPWIP